MKRLLLILSLLIFGEQIFGFLTNPSSLLCTELTNKNATERTKCIYKYLSELSSKSDHKIISGQMTNAFLSPAEGYDVMIDKLFKQSGKWVGIIGTDYVRGWPSKIAQTNEANKILIDHFKNGGLVEIKWSTSNPWTGRNMNDLNNNKNISDLVKLGTPVNIVLNKMMDSIALGLQSLQDSGVTVLWRPFCEMNAGWFWWGSGSETINGATDFKNLWNYVYYYLTITKNLNNLIWVYAPSAKPSGNINPTFKNELYYYPGDEFVDIIGVDVYSDTLDIPNYTTIKSRNKPIALCEFGPSKASSVNLPRNYDYTKMLNQVKTKYPDFVYWLSWNDFTTNGGKDTTFYGMANQLNTNVLLNDSYVITRDDFDWETDCKTITDSNIVLSNKNSSELTKCVFKYLLSLSKKSSKKIISGQMINMGIDHETAYQNDIVGLSDVTGQWVGLIGSNYQRNNTPGLPQNMHLTNARIIEYFKAGGLVTMFCSFTNPWTNKVFNDTTGRYQIMDIIDSTKPVSKEWLKRLDSVAVGIKELQDSGVVVLYRFFPENNGSWFWWGVQTATTPTQSDWRKLWIHAHNYFSNVKKLNNILWVFAPSAKESGNKNQLFKPDMYYYPGNEYVDIVGTAVYNDTLDIPYYEELKKTGKPLALTEFGPGIISKTSTNYDYTIMIKQLKKKYPDFVYWLSWNDFTMNGYKDTIYYSPKYQKNGKALLEDSWVVNREDIDWKSNCIQPSIDTLPINELGNGLWKSYKGGLYPEGKNEIPLAHKHAGVEFANLIKPLDSLGLPDDAKGKIILLSIGMSNTTQEFSAFKSIADTFKLKNPKVTIIDGAQGGQTASIIKDPKANFWTVITQRLNQQRSSASQVQAVWLKEANHTPVDPFPKHAEDLKNDLKAVVKLLKINYPNLKLVYISSRTYGGYATTNLNPEPFAYESGFSVKWLIEEQIEGDTALVYSGAKPNAPWLAWGPYLWGRGVIPRKDGLQWLREDFVADGTHPSTTGRTKVADMLLDFFSTDTTSKVWFLKSANTTTEDNNLDEPIIVFPNPTSSFIEIVLDDNNSLSNNEIMIFNIFGEKVISIKSNDKKYLKINVQALSSGLYFVCASYLDYTRTVSFVVVK